MKPAINKYYLRTGTIKLGGSFLITA